MKKIVINSRDPDLFQIAARTGHRVERLHMRLGKGFCYLDGTLTRIRDAKAKMLAGIELVNCDGKTLNH